MSSDHGPRLRALQLLLCENCIEEHITNTQSISCYCDCHSSERDNRQWRESADVIRAALLRASASALPTTNEEELTRSETRGDSVVSGPPQPPIGLSGPLMTDAMTESAARFKNLFAPVTYDDADGDILAVRMLKKIHRVIVQAKHYRDSQLTEDEMRSIHSAAVAGIEGPDPDYEVYEFPVTAASALPEKEQEERNVLQCGDRGMAHWWAGPPPVALGTRCVCGAVRYGVDRPRADRREHL